MMEHENSSNNDISNMIAMMMQMFGGTGEADENGSASLEQAARIRQAMEMAQMFQMFGSMGQAQEDDVKSESADAHGQNADNCGHSVNTEFYDTPIITPELITIKAAIPHIERKYQQPLAMLVKMVEMRRLMDFYGAEKSVHAASTDACGAGSGQRKRNMLSAIRAAASDETTKTKIDVLLKALDISELMQKIQNT